MSEQEANKVGSQIEEVLNGNSKAEISEVTITEYRKNQIVRMGECAIGLGMIGVAVGMRKKLPAWLSVSMGVVGAGMTIYNGRNLYLNFKQDGKLIREAIKMKKVEEKKIRDERKKKPESPPVNQEHKSEQPPPTDSKKPEVKKAPTERSGNNNSNGSPVVATSPTIDLSKNKASQNSISHDKPNGNGNAVNEVELKRTNTALKYTVHEASVTDSEYREGKEIIATIVESEVQVESSPVEATITSTEATPLEQNGREAVR